MEDSLMTKRTASFIRRMCFIHGSYSTGSMNGDGVCVGMSPPSVNLWVVLAIDLPWMWVGATLGPWPHYTSGFKTQSRSTATLLQTAAWSVSTSPYISLQIILSK